MTDDNFELTHFLPYRLAALSERISKALSEVYSGPHGLSIADWRVLVHTASQQAVSVRDIHRTVNLEKPRVSRSVARLAERGLLKKQVDQTDKRLVTITLTTQGRAILDDILPRALKFESELTKSLDPIQLAALEHAITSIHKHLNRVQTREKPSPS